MESSITASRTSAYTAGGGQGDARIGLPVKVIRGQGSAKAEAESRARLTLEIGFDGSEGLALEERARSCRRELSQLQEQTKEACKQLSEASAKLRRARQGNSSGNDSGSGLRSAGATAGGDVVMDPVSSLDSTATGDSFSTP